jgi:hypothetical protein
MVTADVEGGRPGWLTVAVNEGVGGAVDGQAAESLLIFPKTGAARFLAQAAAPKRRELSPAGGLIKVPASGTTAVLAPAEITQLVRLAEDVPKRFSALRGKRGRPVPADIEFAFRDGRLTLLQLRPFVENRNAQRSEYLGDLDRSARERGAEKVPLDIAPR